MQLGVEFIDETPVYASPGQCGQLRPWYCRKMKNITVTVDDETYRKARIKAAERGTSVSALVKGFLTELAVGESNPERLKRDERALRERIDTFRTGDRLPRKDVHRRDQ
jgi:plasmid stability protein